MTEIQLAARLTANTIRTKKLAEKLAVQAARLDQLQAECAELRIAYLNQQRVIRRLEQRHQTRSLYIQRLRSRIQDSRRSRDLWKHRALRAN